MRCLRESILILFDDAVYGDGDIQYCKACYDDLSSDRSIFRFYNCRDKPITDLSKLTIANPRLCLPPLLD